MTKLDTALDHARDELRIVALDSAPVLVQDIARKSADRVLAAVAPLSDWGLEGADLRDLRLRIEAINQQRQNVLAARRDDYGYRQAPEQFLAEVRKLHAYLMGAAG